MLPLIDVEYEEDQKPLNQFAMQLLEHIEKTPAKVNIWHQPVNRQTIKADIVGNGGVDFRKFGVEA